MQYLDTREQSVELLAEKWRVCKCRARIQTHYPLIRDKKTYTTLENGQGSRRVSMTSRLLTRIRVYSSVLGEYLNVALNSLCSDVPRPRPRPAFDRIRPPPGPVATHAWTVIFKYQQRTVEFYHHTLLTKKTGGIVFFFYNLKCTKSCFHLITTFFLFFLNRVK